MGPGFESPKADHVYECCGILYKSTRPVGQVVKTEASHAFNIGSNPVRVTIFLITIGVDSREVPPVPIPNTEVKLSYA